MDKAFDWINRVIKQDLDKEDKGAKKQPILSSNRSAKNMSKEGSCLKC